MNEGKFYRKKAVKRSLLYETFLRFILRDAKIRPCLKQASNWEKRRDLLTAFLIAVFKNTVISKNQKASL